MILQIAPYNLNGSICYQRSSGEINYSLTVISPCRIYELPNLIQIMKEEK